LFYSDDPMSQTIAVQVCARCGVRLQCLAEALDVEAGVPVGLRHGVRGGLTPSQRARLPVNGRAHTVLTES
jgi:hypothetical protein